MNSSKLKDIFGFSSDSEGLSNSYLGDIFNSMLDKSVGDLTINEICILCRQDMVFDDLLDRVLQLLELDIESGDQYDGELLESLKKISFKNISQNKKEYFLSKINELVALPENETN